MPDKMNEGLIQRIRSGPHGARERSLQANAARIKAQARIEALEKALEPFASAADKADAWNEKHGDADDDADLDFITNLKVGDLRRARQLLSQPRGEQE